MTPPPGEMTFSLNRPLLAGGVTITNSDVRESMRSAHGHFRFVTEAGVVVGYTAVLDRQMPVKGRIIATAITAGNIDSARFRALLEDRSTPSGHLMAEWLGTVSLFAMVVGSGIKAAQLADGNVTVALLGNAIPAGAILVVLITIFGPISGVHFNPAVTLCFAMRRQIIPRNAGLYVLAQVFGGFVGVLAALVMCEHLLIDPSTKARTSIGQWAGEYIATYGLIGIILACLKARPQAVPIAVGLYITAVYWFTSSTSFACPAVTIAWGFSNTFAGIAPTYAVIFIMVQLIAAVLAIWFFRWMLEDYKDG